MRGKFIRLVVIMMVLLSPYVLQFPSVSPAGSQIVIITGESKSGSLSLVNPSVFYYKRVVLRDVWVEGPNGTVVKGFNVSLFPKVVNGWPPRQAVEFWYNISTSKDVPPGNYSLKIRFLGVLQDNSLNRFVLSVPLRVIGSPLVFGKLSLHPEKKVLIGDKLVVYLPVSNIGNRNISVGARLSVEGAGKLYYSERKTFTLPPGNSSIAFEVPVTSKFKDGDYNVTVEITYGEKTYRVSSSIRVSLGAKLFSVSLEKNEFYPNENGTLYVTLLSERTGTSVLYVYTYQNSSQVDVRVVKVPLSPGTQVVNVPLVTKSPGTYSVKVQLVVEGVVGGSYEVSYTVVKPPAISNVTIIRDGKNLTFLVEIINEGSPCQGVLKYQFALNNRVLSSGSKIVTLPKGKGEVEFNLSLQEGGTLSYRFILEFRGFTSKSEGQIVIPSATTPSPVRSNTSTTSTGVETSTSSLQVSSTSNSGKILTLILVGLVALVFVVWYYNEKGKRAKKRSRPKPKRRSPLGRFKRPRIPKFRERDSLPKKR